MSNACGQNDSGIFAPASMARTVENSVRKRFSTKPFWWTYATLRRCSMPLERRCVATVELMNSVPLSLWSATMSEPVSRSRRLVRSTRTCGMAAFDGSANPQA